MTAINFTGLASGIDTQAIIDTLLESQRAPITRLQNKSQVLGVQRQAYRDVNTQLLSLQNETLSLRLESTFSSRSASSSDESALKVQAAFSAVKTSHRVKVLQLAQDAIVSSQRYLSQARLLGTNTVGINLLGGTSRVNAPGAGRIKGSVTMSETATLADLGLAGDFTLKIDPDGSGSRSAIKITGLDGSTTVSQLMNKIQAQVDSLKVQLVYDEAQGGKVLQITSDFVGIDVSASGAVAEQLFGIAAGATADSSSSTGLGSARNYAAVTPEDFQTGEYTVVSSDGAAGSLTGSVDLAAAAAGGDILALTLDDLGVTDFGTFQIDPDAAGNTGNVEIRKSDGSALSGSDTVANLIDAINSSVPDVTAQLVEGSGGATYLRLAANEGGRDITVNDFGATDGILQHVLGNGGGTVTTSNATSDSNDFSLVATFYERGSLTPASRRVVSGVKENYRTVGVSDLIDGVTIIGSTLGQIFTPGSARIQVNNSNGMAIENSAKTQLFGRAGVTDSSFATGLALDPDGSGTAGLNRAISDLNSAGAFAYDDGLGITAGTFRVGNSTLTITQDEIDNGLTVAQVLARINSANQGITVAYEAGTDRFVASSSRYGSDTAFTLGTYTGGAGESNVLKALGLVNAPAQTSLSVGNSSGQVSADTELSQAGFSIKPTSGTFTINGISIEVNTAEDTLNEIIEKINSSAAGVTASLDSVSNQISIVQNVDKDTTATSIKVGASSDTSNLLKALRLTTGSNADGSISRIESPTSATVVSNQRTTAEIEVDGVHYSRNTNVIDDVTPGLTYDLQGETSSPVTVTVSGDKDRALEAIARWVVEYNKTVKLLNPARLDQSERKNLEPLTDKERSTLTFNELSDRLNKFEQYNKGETIRRDSNFRVLESQLRQAIFARVTTTGTQYASLGDIGINTGNPGQPLSSNFESVLVADSTDHDVILDALKQNETLNQALDNSDRAIFQIFSQVAASSVSVKGTRTFDGTTALANDISFQVSNGANATNISLPAGTSTQSDILGIILNQLRRAGINDINASFDAGNHLLFTNATDKGRAQIRIIDLTSQSESDRMSTIFGINGGSFVGEDAAETAGVAERMNLQLRDSTGISGFISQRASFGGTFGQGTIYDELVRIQEDINSIEERVTRREERLKRQFTAMEQALARLQEQQSALSNFLGAASTASTSLGNQSGG